MQRQCRTSRAASVTSSYCARTDCPRWSCAVRDTNMGHHYAGGYSSWCPGLKSRTTHRRAVRGPVNRPAAQPGQSRS